MRLLITLASYTAFLLLTMAASAEGMAFAALFLILGALLMICKSVNFSGKFWTNYSFYIAIALSIYSGMAFYKQWLPSSAVSSIASKFRLPTDVFIIIVATVLSACAVWFIHFLLKYMHDLLTNLTRKKSFSSIFICVSIVSTVTVFMSQTMMGATMISIGVIKGFFGALIIAVTILALYCLTGATKTSIILGSGVFMLLSTINVYVYIFRARTLDPADIFSFETAMNVVGDYSLFPVPFRIILSWAIWASVLIYLFKNYLMTKYSFSFIKRALIALFCIVGATSIFFYTSTLTIHHWGTDPVTFNGYILNFTAKVKQLYIQKPNGYSEEYIEEMSAKYSLKPNDLDSNKRPPHIIVIMDEAFSDLSVLGEISTNEAITPYFHSLKKNTVCGYALASVYGGNTSSSEFEFLTGNSMAFLPLNSVPYQQYVKPPQSSMVSYLKSNYGYRCLAMHPYSSNGWNRPTTYKTFGFDRFISEEDFPQKQLVRGYISDRELFEMIIATYESNGNEPLFIFGVTMQNHGPYVYDGANYTKSISLVDNGNFTQTEQYLSLIHETDKAIEYLISYFEKVEEDVVIAFFGDHQPILEDEFYKNIGADDNSLDKIQSKYTVPFFVWTNYDTDEKTVALTSLNYLSNYVYNAAGIPLPPYNQFLSKMEEHVPAINANGFYSAKSGTHLPLNQASNEELQWIEDYKKLQYNNLFDKNSSNRTFFPIDD